MKVWHTFLGSLICLIGFPLLPLLLERMITGSIEDSTWSITAAIYCVSVGIVSQALVIFVVGAIAGTTCAAMYGATASIVKAGTANAQQFHSFHQFALNSAWLIAIFSILLVIERFKRHILDQAPFFEFKT